MSCFFESDPKVKLHFIFHTLFASSWLPTTFASSRQARMTPSHYPTPTIL
ncbi:hypothetical protein TSMEX_000551 [Taenia solium]|eukprot:TsM_000530500 transcript=TsM_000530500 gene=TsM_000530500